MAEPVIKLSDRALSIGVFVFKNQDGTENISCDIQRSYKKKDAQDWTRENIHCYEDELLKIANICTRAYNAICNRRASKSKAQAQAPAQAPAPVPAQTQAPVDDEIPF